MADKPALDYHIISGKGRLIDRATCKGVARRVAAELSAGGGWLADRKQTGRWLTVLHAPSGEVVTRYCNGEDTNTPEFKAKRRAQRRSQAAAKRERER